jgi:hypothetical protein
MMGATAQRGSKGFVDGESDGPFALMGDVCLGSWTGLLYGCFTEVFDTNDLKEAKALLEELAS